MDEAEKQIVSMGLLTVGNFILWSSLFIGFIEWSYSMGFFRVSIAGLIMIAIGTYLRFRWNLDE